MLWALGVVGELGLKCKQTNKQTNKKGKKGKNIVLLIVLARWGSVIIILDSKLRQ